MSTQTDLEAITEAQYWRERSRLLEEYVQHIPPASAFNGEGRAAYKDWSAFVNNTVIPMPTRPLSPSKGVGAQVDEMMKSDRKPVDIPAMADELTKHLAKMKLPTDPHGWKTIVRIALIGKLSTLTAMGKEDTRRIACPRCMPPGDPCCPYCDGTYEINTPTPTKE